MTNNGRTKMTVAKLEAKMDMLLEETRTIRNNMDNLLVESVKDRTDLKNLIKDFTGKQKSCAIRFSKISDNFIEFDKRLDKDEQTLAKMKGTNKTISAVVAILISIGIALIAVVL